MSDVHARILLWGIEGCGKTTTLQTIHDKLRADLRGELRQEPTRWRPVHGEGMRGGWSGRPAVETSWWIWELRSQVVKNYRQMEVLPTAKDK